MKERRPSYLGQEDAKRLLYYLKTKCLMEEFVCCKYLSLNEDITYRNNTFSSVSYPKK